MRLKKEHIGKQVIRTKANNIGDTSHTNRPIILVDIGERNIFHTSTKDWQHIYNKDVYMLSKLDWDDNNWVLYCDHSTEDITMNKNWKYCPNCGKALNHSK